MHIQGEMKDGVAISSLRHSFGGREAIFENQIWVGNEAGMLHVQSHVSGLTSTAQSTQRPAVMGEWANWEILKGSSPTLFSTICLEGWIDENK
jgi:hypothetical protein